MKKLSKICLKDIEVVELSTEQMKLIVGGYSSCKTGECYGDCTVEVGNLIYSGKCDLDISSGSMVCGCKITL